MNGELEERKVIKVVVASPGDVMAERNALDQVIDELNHSLAPHFGSHVQLLRWETDSYPGFHPEGPQGLIDEKLKIKDCDILIGLFWTRFGTPTAAGKTGTEHEIETARKSWEERRRPRLMIYFKSKSYSPKSSEETDQWGKVLQFKKSFPKEGLWWPFPSTAAFERLVRGHLIKVLLEELQISRFSYPYRVIRSAEELHRWNRAIVAGATTELVATGSRARDQEHLRAIEDRLAKTPALRHLRILFGPPHWKAFQEHLLRLLELRDPEDRSQGYKTLSIGLFDEPLKQAEVSLCASQELGLVVLPSLQGLGEYNTALLLEDQDDVRGLLRLAKELYTGSKPLEKKEEIAALPVLKPARR